MSQGRRTHFLSFKRKYKEVQCFHEEPPFREKLNLSQWDNPPKKEILVTSRIFSGAGTALRLCLNMFSFY